MKTKLKNNKGITLVALIITIIVLLILAMVSIRLVMNGGIIDRAEKGTKAYTESEVQEQIKLAYQEYQMAKYSEAGYTLQNALAKTGLEIVSVEGNDSIGYEVKVNTRDGEKSYVLQANGAVGTASTEWTYDGHGTYTKGIKQLQVGDTVHYETELAKTANAVNSTKKAGLITDLGTYSGNTDTSYNTDSSVVRDSLTWKVLDVKDGKIRLISAVPTSSQIRLQGENGYNNAVYLLDKACDTLYSIDGVGKVQNLKIEDIEKHLIYDYTQYAKSGIDTGKYGGTAEHTSSPKYPNIYPSEIGCKGIDGTSGTDNNTGTLGLSSQTSPVTGSSTATSRLKVTQTYWHKSIETKDLTDLKYYTLFINNGSNLSYWLSSRCVDFSLVSYPRYFTDTCFCVSYVEEGYVSGYNLFRNDGGYLRYLCVSPRSFSRV